MFRDGHRIEDRKKIFAVASGGGHWVQLMRVIPAFAGHDMVFATVSRSYQSDIPAQHLYVVPDATRWNKLVLIWMALKLVGILLMERPGVVISTGAAPGFFAIWVGSMLGMRTIWIDSIANAESLSLSGQKIGRHADLWLTQWPHLARPEGPHFMGAVL